MLRLACFHLPESWSHNMSNKKNSFHHPFPRSHLLKDFRINYLLYNFKSAHAIVSLIRLSGRYIMIDLSQDSANHNHLTILKWEVTV